MKKEIDLTEAGTLTCARDTIRPVLQPALVYSGRKVFKDRMEPSTGSTQSNSPPNKAPVISPRKESAETIDAKRVQLEKFVGESLVVKHFVDEITGESVLYGGHVERLLIDEEGTFFC